MPTFTAVMLMSKMIIKSNLGEVKAEMASRIPVILEAVGLQAEGNAITEISKLVYDTPPSPDYVRTGRLRNSITHATDQNSTCIGTNVEYAPYVELGTYRMKARPFLRNAIENYQAEYEDIVKKGLS